MVVMFQKELVGDARGVSACAWARKRGEDVLVLARGPWLEAYKVVERSLVLMCSTRLASYVSEIGVFDDDDDDAGMEDDDEEETLIALHLAPCKIVICELEGATPRFLWDLADEMPVSEFDRGTMKFAGFAGIAVVGRKLAALDVGARKTVELDYESRLSVADVDAVSTGPESAVFAVTFRDAVDAAVSQVRGYECMKQDEMAVVPSTWFSADVPGLVFATKLRVLPARGGLALLCASPHRISVVEGTLETGTSVVRSVILNPFASVVDKSLASSDVNSPAFLGFQPLAVENGESDAPPPEETPMKKECTWEMELSTTAALCWLMDDVAIVAAGTALVQVVCIKDELKVDVIAGLPGLEPLAAEVRLTSRLSADHEALVFMGFDCDDSLLCAVDLKPKTAIFLRDAIPEKLLPEEEEDEPMPIVKTEDDEETKPVVAALLERGQPEDEPKKEQYGCPVVAVDGVKVLDALPALGRLTDATACPRLPWLWPFQREKKKKRSRPQRSVSEDDSQRGGSTIEDDNAVLCCAGSALAVVTVGGLAPDLLWSRDGVTSCAAVDDEWLVATTTTGVQEWYRLGGSPTTAMTRTPSQVIEEDETNAALVAVEDDDAAFTRAQTRVHDRRGVKKELRRGVHLMDDGRLEVKDELTLRGPYEDVCDLDDKTICVHVDGKVDIFSADWTLEASSAASVLAHPPNLFARSDDDDIADDDDNNDDEMVRAVGAGYLAESPKRNVTGVNAPTSAIPVLAVVTSLALLLYDLSNGRSIPHGYPLCVGVPSAYQRTKRRRTDDDDVKVKKEDEDGADEEKDDTQASYVGIIAADDLESRSALVIGTSVRSCVVLNARGAVRVVDLRPSKVSFVTALPAIRGLALVSEDRLLVCSGLGNVVHRSYHKIPMGTRCVAKKVVVVDATVEEPATSGLLLQAQAPQSDAFIAAVLVSTQDTTKPVQKKKGEKEEDAKPKEPNTDEDQDEAATTPAFGAPVDVLLGATPGESSATWAKHRERDELRVVALAEGIVTQQCLFMAGETGVCLAGLRATTGLAVAVGTAIRRDEDRASRGRVLLFGLVRHDGQRPKRRPTLELRVAKHCSGVVHAVAGLEDRFLVIAVSARIEVHEIVQSALVFKLRQVAQHHAHGSLVTDLKTAQRYVLACDAYRGPRLLFWRRRDKLLAEVARDDEHVDDCAKGHSAATLLVDVGTKTDGKGAKLFAVVARDDASMSLLEYAPLSKAGKIRTSKALRRRFHVDAVAPVAAFAEIHPGLAVAADDDGAVHGLRALSDDFEAQFRTLLASQRLLANAAPSPAGLCPDRHRLPTHHYLLLDLDLLLVYLGLPTKTQHDLASAIATSRSALLNALAHLDLSLLDDYD